VSRVLDLEIRKQWRRCAETSARLKLGVFSVLAEFVSCETDAKPSPQAPDVTMRIGQRHTEDMRKERAPSRSPGNKSTYRLFSHLRVGLIPMAEHLGPCSPESAGPEEALIKQVVKHVAVAKSRRVNDNASIADNGPDAGSGRPPHVP